MSDSDDSVWLAFDEPEGGRSVVLEDDGTVAYAYLLVESRIVSDVWLYNCAVPAHEGFINVANAPPPNPSSYSADAHVPRLRSDSAVICIWSATDVAIEVEGVLVARLSAGAKPGWSLGATRPGPVALPLSMFPRR